MSVSSDKNKLVSVIMPIYNVEAFLKCAIDSVLHQDYENLEIILVDDGSTDNSGNICDEYAKKDNRIQVIHKNNGGLSSARNAGLDVFKGKYVYFIDSDDFIAPNAISSALTAMKEDHSDLVIFNYYYVDESNNVMKRELDNNIKPIWSIDDFWNYISDVSNTELSIASVVAWNKLYKREIFESLRYLEGRINEDSFIITDIIRQVSKISYINEPLYYYRTRSGSIMSSRGTKGITDSTLSLIKRCKYFNEFKYDELLASHFRTIVSDYLNIKKHKKELTETQLKDLKVIDSKIKYLYQLLKYKKLKRVDRISIDFAYHTPRLFLLVRKFFKKK